MATGSGKTFTVISFIYHWLQFTEAKRIGFWLIPKTRKQQGELSEEKMNAKSIKKKEIQ